MSDRNKQRQIWSDEEFVKRLERIKAMRLLNGKPIKNIGQLTKEILQCPSWDKVEQELIKKIEKDKARINLQIKLDHQKLLK